MNKQKFLSALKRQLKSLKKEERNKYIEYYEEMISDIVESGVSEEEAIKRQGSIEQIAGEILSNANPAYLKTRDWRGMVLGALSVIMLLVCMASAFLEWQFKQNINSTVTIIGGADGPTSIFIAGQVGAPWGIYIATAVIVIVTVVHFIRKYRR